MSRYLVLEGPDGGGKTTQAVRLLAWLEERGHRVRHLREPGSTGLGEALRNVLLAPETGELTVAAEALLFFAARAEMIEHEVRPALAAGEVVVAERCYLSTWVYQGVAAPAGLPQSAMRVLTEQSCGDALPDRVFVLDVDWRQAAQRRGDATEDRIEARGQQFHDAVRAGYLALAEGDERCEVIETAAGADAVFERLRNSVAALLEAPAS